MSMSTKKRLVLGSAAFTTVAAAATLVAGVTFGFFSAAATPQSNTFTSGTVSLGAPANATCVIPAYIVPGDSGTCTFDVTYSGNASAFVGLDTSVTGALFTGVGTDDAGANHLVVAVTQGATSFANNSSNLYVATDTSGAGARTFTVNWNLPSGADNSYQNLGAAISLTVHAVQSANNGSCPTPGAACVGTAWV